MQKLSLPALALGAALLFGACEEKPITIPELTVGKRNVLVEELTGVRCPNCPDGTATLVNLGDQFGDNLIVVSIHAAPGYDDPYPESKYDFWTAKGEEAANFIGAASFFPTASINRRIVPPETEPYLPRAIWAGIIAEELAEDPAVGLSMEKTFDPVSRKLDISVNILPDATLSGEHRLSVMITQDSIVDYQKVNLDKVPNYMHRHVLREILTQATGDVITEPLTASSTITKNFSITLPAGWKEDHCSIVAFVHHGTVPDKEVLQVIEEHVIE